MNLCVTSQSMQGQQKWHHLPGASHASDLELREAEQGSARARKAEGPAAASDYKISQEFFVNVCKVRECLAPSINLKNVMALFCLCLFNFT